MPELSFELPSSIKETWDSEKNTYEPKGPEDTTPVWWKCKEGHSFLKSIPTMKRFGRCPICGASGFEKTAHRILDSYDIPYECEAMPEWLDFSCRYDIHILATA